MGNSGKKVNEIGEYELIQTIEDILGGLGNEILTGQDDAVAISTKNLASPILIINNDMLVSTTDIPPKMTLFEAGRKAVIMTASDVLVKGGKPKWGIVSLGFPRNLNVEGQNGFKGLIRGLKKGFNELAINYIGGDLNESKEIIISCTIIGEATIGKVIPRSGAQVGDIIISNGEFGKTGCGFNILINGNEPNEIPIAWKESFVYSVLNPVTDSQYAEILIKNGWVTASADSSDGVYKTIYEICKASGVGAELYWKSLPIAEGVEEFSQTIGAEIEDLLFRAGEEFLHIYTVPKKKYKEAESYFKNRNLPFYKIGKIVEGKPEVFLIRKQDQRTALSSKKKGFEHFSKE